LDLRIEARPAPLVGRSTRSNPLRAAHPRRGSPTSCGGPIPTAANLLRWTDTDRGESVYAETAADLLNWRCCWDLPLGPV